MLHAAEAAPVPDRATLDVLDGWIASIVSASGLGVADVRKGVRSLSSRYVERRGLARGAPADASPARRVAFASYYGALHLITTHAVVASRGRGEGLSAGRILDLGAGSGAAGIGAALALAGRPHIEALDRAPRALAIAREGFWRFGLEGRTRRGALPRAMPRAGRGDLVVAGWVLNELDDAARAEVVDRIREALARGAALLVLEPLSTRVAPWWDEVASALAPAGVERGLEKWPIERPAWIAEIDRAAGLDHREIGARFLWGPVR